jgi:hypothetical protein
MTTTCQDIVARAQAFSPAMNAPLTGDTSVMLSRIRADQSALFSKAAEVNRDFFSVSATLTSSAGSASRTASIGSLTPPVERILQLTLPSGVDVNQVDPLDIDGELAPRYLAQGTTLREVNGEWGASGTVTLSLLYVQAPVDIDPTGTLNQVVSLPDRWTDILVLNLAQYLHHVDVGRDPSEGERLQALADARLQDFFNYLGHFGGVEARRFVIPTPTGSKN